jgi:hypothetical protein
MATTQQAEGYKLYTDPNTALAANKGVNIGVGVLFTVMAAIALAISIGLFKYSYASTPLLADGRWHGAISLLVLAVLPLSFLAGFTFYKASRCEGDVIGTALKAHDVMQQK